MNIDELNKNSIGELIEPTAIGYSFNTPGWYIIGACVLLLVFITGIIQLIKYKRNAYRRNAVKKIDTLAINNNQSAPYEINKLIKIQAIKLYGRLRVGALYGDEWFEFLKTSMGQKRHYNFEAFSQAIYNPSFNSSETKSEFIEFAKAWFTNHKANV